MLLRYSLQESSTDWVPDPRRRKDGIHPKMYVGCSQNYGPLDLQIMLRHPIFGVPKLDPKFGNYPCLKILVSGAVSLLQKEGAGLMTCHMFLQEILDQSRKLSWSYGGTTLTAT